MRTRTAHILLFVVAAVMLAMTGCAFRKLDLGVQDGVLARELRPEIPTTQPAGVIDN